MSKLPLINQTNCAANITFCLRVDGDQDRCFYNFQCLKPAGSLIMGNHLLSNVPYPILGFLFIKVVRMKELFEDEKRKETDVRDTGVALDYGMFYTMGLTLVMIGVMSACYHICPTSINFQFDTTYMHLLAIFMYFSLFKSRHPDVAPDAIAAFSMLAFSVTLGVLLSNSDRHIINLMQVISVYTDGPFKLILKSFLAGIYIWFCATMAIIFYGVDKKKGDKSWGWIQVILL